ncbi:uncharacterized protein ColSpa_08922 [Colletotrichum spaethianum]|uniref:Uncharacterized protein n=1 Tax=Colletotrichum spaethianum TaxID=700344 RepID=A0AA37PAL6_9PEZI|nr:uncharacterized protein ColSpa_08922 [Colletotrichum spaethianum]GKT48741.1 hypothetical protein ColSpa_08922 [Colletotrichum spaethianum]
MDRKGYVICWPTINAANWNNLINQDSIGNDIKSLDRVRHVALGVNGSHIILHGTNRWRYAISSNYPVLDAIMDNLSGSMNVTFVALNPWKANEFLLIVDNDTAYFALDSRLENIVTENLRELGIDCNSVVKYNPTRTVAKPRPIPNIKNKEFLREMLGHAFGGTVGAVAASVITGLGLSCTVM